MAAGGGENVRGRRPMTQMMKRRWRAKLRYQQGRRRRSEQQIARATPTCRSQHLYPECFPIGRAKRLPKKPAAKEIDKPKIKEERKKRKVESFV
jgi:hypothetical protein